MKNENKVTLTPKDYIVLSGGLKIENVSEDKYIEVTLDKYIVGEMKYLEAERK